MAWTNRINDVLDKIADRHLEELRTLRARIAELEARQVPEGYKVVPDLKPGVKVRYRESDYEIFAYGDKPDTFDLSPVNVDSSDQWRNVPPSELVLLAGDGAAADNGEVKS